MSQQIIQSINALLTNRSAANDKEACCATYQRERKRKWNSNQGFTRESKENGNDGRGRGKGKGSMIGSLLGFFQI